MSAQVKTVNPQDAVEFFADGKLLGRAQQAPWKFDWNSHTHIDGRVVVTARVIDPAGAVVPSAGNLASVLYVVNHAIKSVPGRSIITLGFDDGTADQLVAANMLNSRNLHGVFYVNSGRVGEKDYLRPADLLAIQTAGNEIGGHTVYHLHLSELSAPEQARQICTDRNQLTAMGLTVTDLAYPFGALDSSTPTIAEQCGYNSARTSGTVDCPNCTGTETLPPRRLYDMTSLTSLGLATTLADLQAEVIKNESAGTWGQIVLHHLCTNTLPCQTNAIRQAVFSTFLDWLQKEAALGRVQVVTPRQALGLPVRPLTAPPPAHPSSELQNSSFELDSNADGIPDCWEYSTVGSSNASWQRTSDAHTGLHAERVNLLTSGGKVGLRSTQDLGGCAPHPTGQQTVTAWYKSTVPITLGVYRRRANGGYDGHAGPSFPASATWTFLKWVIPARFGDTQGFGVKIEIQQPGSLVLDDVKTAMTTPAELLAAAPVTTHKVRVHVVHHKSPKRRHSPVSALAMSPTPLPLPLTKESLAPAALVQVDTPENQPWRQAGLGISIALFALALIRFFERRLVTVGKTKTKVAAAHGS